MKIKYTIAGEEVSKAVWDAFADKGKRISRLETLLNPREWNRAQDNAWHRNLPDVYKAFEALRLSNAQDDSRDLSR